MSLLIEIFETISASTLPEKKGVGRSNEKSNAFGVQKLREYILNLAVHGKLVSQDKNDEPSKELLKKLKSEKAKMISKGEIRESKQLSTISEEEKPFELPDMWEWLRLIETGKIFNGNSINENEKLRKFTNIKGGLPFIATKDVGYGREEFDYENGVRIPIENEKLKVARKNALLICSEGGSAGKKIGITNQDICFGNKLIANELFEGLEPKFVLCIYQSAVFYECFKNKMTGIIGGISMNEFLSIPIPIPPLEEQKRIVTKVDQLMALCDELEAKQEKQTHARRQLNDAALNALLSATSPEEFEKHWQRIIDNFDLLYDDLENLKSLRRGILTLAVQGKLTNNRDNSFLTTSNSNNGYPFVIPSDWEWLKLGDVANKTEYGTSYKSEKTRIGIPVLRMGNIQNGMIDFSNLKYVPNKIDDLPKLFLKKSDLLFNRTNSYELVGKTGIYEGDDNKYTFASYLIRIEVNSTKAYGRYLNIVMNSSYYRKTQIEPDVSQQCGQANFNGTKLSNTLIPIPPLIEQKRIVAKVDQLMAQCDALEKKLNTKSAHLEKLTGSLLR